MRAILVLFLLSGLLHAGEPVVDPSASAGRDANDTSEQDENVSSDKLAAIHDMLNSFVTSLAKQDSAGASKAMAAIEDMLRSLDASPAKQDKIVLLKALAALDDTKALLGTLISIQDNIIKIFSEEKRFEVRVDISLNIFRLEQFNFILEYFVHPGTGAQIRSDIELVLAAARLVLHQNGIDIDTQQPSLRFQARNRLPDTESRGQAFTNLLRLGNAHWDYASRTLKYEQTLSGGLLQAGEPVVDPSMPAKRDASDTSEQDENVSSDKLAAIHDMIVSFVILVGKQDKVDIPKALTAVQNMLISLNIPIAKQDSADVSKALTAIQNALRSLNASSAKQDKVVLSKALATLQDTKDLFTSLISIQDNIKKILSEEKRFNVVLHNDLALFTLRQFNFVLRYFVHPGTEAQILTDFESVFSAARLILQQHGIDIDMQRPSLRFRALMFLPDTESRGQVFINFIPFGKAHWDYASRTLKYDRSWYEWSDGED